MRTKFKVFLTLLLALVVQISFAQEKMVTGVVTEAGTGEPLPGVNVLVKGTNRGAATDFDGKYSIKVKPEDVLIFSSVGYQTVEKKVGGATTINVQLKSGAVLDQVVVTAMGITREKKALGYAVSKVKDDQIAEKTEGDIGRILTGKVSSLQIVQQNGLSGSGTDINIRGMNSFTGSNQPLFVIDGVPFASDTNAQGDFIDGNNGSSRFLDLDPNNIASVTVLKGLAAATLYGTQGRNGVILITTKTGDFKKKGAKKTEISINSSYVLNKIASLPNYQNDFGNGFDQAFGWYFSNWGPSFKKDGPAGWGNDSTIASDGTLPHPYSTASPATGIPQAFPEFAGVRYPYKPYENVSKFFRTGVVQNFNILAKGSSNDGNFSYNVAFGNYSDQGFTPGNDLKRKNFSVGGRAKLSNKFTVFGSMNYANTDFETPPVAAGYGSNVAGKMASIFANLFYTPRSIDMMNLPYQNPITGESVYYRQNNSIQHPLWTVHNAKNIQKTDRIYGGLNIAYDITDKIQLSYRLGLDTYNEDNVNYSNKGGKTGSEKTQSGIYETWNNIKTIYDHNLMINGNHKFNDNLDMNFNFGVTGRYDNYDRQGISSSGQQVFGVLRHFNFQNKEEIQYKSQRNILGAYGMTEFGYKNMLFVSLAGRNDWVSNLSKEHRSIFYPSASISFIPTAAFDNLKTDKLNFLKFRVGYGTSANFPTGYPVSDVLVFRSKGFKPDVGDYIQTNTLGNTLGNPDLKPELIAELEFGMESRFLNNRLSLDVSLYNRNTKDLIISQPLDPSTGYTSRLTNVGKIRNNGVEIDLGAQVLKNFHNFNWNMNVNWSKNRAVVVDLGNNTDKIVYAGFSDLGNVAMEGESLGAMIGHAIKRDDNGNLMVNASGSYIEDSEISIIGDATPDFNMNFSSDISYKNISLGFLFTWVQGGDIYSTTVATLLGRGVVSQEGIDRTNSFILPGVKPNGEPNNIQINNSTYYFGNVLYGPAEMLVYDATRFRLQELSLSYSLPKKLLKNLPFGKITITAKGNNLWLYAPNIPKNTNFDPNVAGLGVGNGKGFEYLNAPTSRRYGLSIGLTF